MSASTNDQRPWMIAVWPGMGHVALSAGYYLMAKLGMRQFAELSPENLFDVDGAIVTQGIVQKPQWPRHRVFICDPSQCSRPLIVFIGEAQPPSGKYAFCEKLIDFARDQQAERIITFAAMVTEMNPGEDGRVFVAATDGDLLRESENLSAVPLDDGRVGGLNGVLLAAATEKGMPGVCLLGEMPHVFAQMLYPKPSLAVLTVLAAMAQIDLDLAEMAQHAEATEHHLNKLVEQVRSNIKASQTDQAEESLPGDEWKTGDGLSSADQEHIETLFKIASADRSRAYELKSELDRLGVFQEYEDRFLDLFTPDP